MFHVKHSTKSIVQKRKETESLPHKADPTERSWRGVLRGHVPSKSLSADSEIPCARALGRTEQVGEKSDSFSRAERFQRIFHDKKIRELGSPERGAGSAQH